MATMTGMAPMTGMSIVISIVVAVMLMNMSRAVCHLHSPTVAPSADLAYGLHTERERAPAMP
jgi:hypothetical protein